LQRQNFIFLAPQLFLLPKSIACGNMKKIFSDNNHNEIEIEIGKRFV